MSKGRSLALVALAYVLAVGLAAAWLGWGPRTGRLWLDTLIADLLATLVIFVFSRIYRNSSFYDAHWSVIPPLLLAGVRAALFQTLFQEALSGYQALLAQQPIEQRDQVVLAVEPARLGAAAQLLLDAPTLNAAVSLLALGAFLQRQPAQEHV